MKVDESPAVAPDVPDDIPEDGEPDVEGALTRPEKRARGRLRKRVLLDIACRIGISAFQGVHASAPVQTAAASGAAAASASTASGAARAVSGTASETAIASGDSDGGTASGSVPGTRSGSVQGVTSGSTPVSARDSTIRKAETLAEEDQEAHKFVKLNDDEEETNATLWGSERISKVGEITDVTVTVPMERNEMDCSNIRPEHYYDLVDEDNGQPLDARKVAEGVHLEMKFLDEQRLADTYLRKDVPESAVVWTARW
eukprot:5666810-Amphidinium_carterae.2